MMIKQATQSPTLSHMETNVDLFAAYYFLNIVSKEEENAHDEQFLPLSQCFQLDSNKHTLISIEFHIRD